MIKIEKMDDFTKKKKYPPTPAQWQAIALTGADVLVAAAAGSGKTEVLSERIARKVALDRWDIDKLLVLTFTTAAAKNMLVRVENKITERLLASGLEKDRLFLRKQSMLMNDAYVSTIDSFCLNILRKFYYLVEEEIAGSKKYLSPNFNILPNSKNMLINSANEVLERFARENKIITDELFTIFGDKKNIIDSLIDTYYKLLTIPNFEQYLQDDFLKNNNILLHDFLLNNEIVIDDFSELVELTTKESLNTARKFAIHVKNFLVKKDNGNIVERYLSKSLLDDNKKEKIRKYFIENDVNISTSILEQEQCLGNIINSLDNELNKNYNIYDATLLNNIFNDLNNYYSMFQTAKKLDTFSTAYQTTLLELHNEFLKRKRELNFLDFSDLNHLAIKALTKIENGKIVLSEAAEYYRNHFLEIYVDEYQDTNVIQYKLIKMLSEVHKNICIVGDDDQSIYSWRGACSDNIINFEKDYEDVEVIFLDQNYRSNSTILDAANAVIKNNTDRKDKALWSENKGGDKITVYAATNDKDETDDIAKKILDLKAQGVDYKDIAILYRANYLSRSMENSCMVFGIPYKLIGSLKFLQRQEIRDLLAYMNVIVNKNDEFSLRRIINVPKRGIGASSMAKIDNYAEQYGLSLFEALKNIDMIGVSKKIITNIHLLTQLIEKYSQTEQYSIEDLIVGIYKDSGYESMLKESADAYAESRIENISELVSSAKQFSSMNDNLIDFISEMSLTSDADDENEDDSVVLSTVHAAKGLEYRVVFIMGLEENLFPSIRDAESSEDERNKMEEERRLAYVAITRAKEKLFITGTSKNLNKKLEDLEKQTEIYHKNKEKINPVLVKKYKSYLDWILLVYQYEKNSTQDLLELNIIDRDIFSKLNKTDIQEINSQKIKELMENKDIEISKEQMEDIKNKIEYEYQNKLATTIPTKSSVTKIKQMQQKTLGVNIESLDENPTEVQENKEKKIEFGKPKFLQNDEEQKITPAQKGTLIHLCMQKLNFKEEYNLEKISELIQKLKNKEIITEKEAKAINMSKILNFTKSDIAKELKEAKEIYKEKPFYINVPAREIYKENCEENILVQGIIDLYYIDKDDNLKLLDYKTDYVEPGNEQELVKKYSKQLELYKEALEEALNKKVEKVYIYSVYLEKAIEI